MKVGICGFSGSGKSTVFHWLTGVVPDPARSQQGQLGKPAIEDPRLEFLSGLFNPKKKTPAQLEFLDTPGLLMSERRDNPRRLGIMRDAGGLLIVLNGYSGGNLLDELKKFREEIIFADLEIVMGRIERLQDQLKKPRSTKQKEIDQAEIDILKNIQSMLEAGESDLSHKLKPDEEKLVRSFQLLTLKRQVVFVNVGDELAGKPLPEDLLSAASSALAAPAKLERELEDLSEEDRKMFMEEMGVTGSSRAEVMRKIFAAMGQIVFFTVGEDECRAWVIPAGVNAQEAAGEIHTDLSRGFVRAEVVSYADFEACKSFKEAKSKGVYRLESKTYIVKDADIMHILAST